MDATETLKKELQDARQLHARGQHGEAEHRYLKLLDQDVDREAVLCCLVELYMQQGRVEDVVDMLKKLTEAVPDRLYYFCRLASLLDGLGRTQDAIEQYLRLLQNNPGLADAYFNLALLYKNSLRYQDALKAYQSAVDLKISNIQEVFSNMGVLYADMHRFGDALAMYDKALDVDPGYIPAMFNKAGLYEESGNRESASRQYEQILAREPQHWDSIIRLAQMQRADPDNTEMVSLLRRSIDTCTDQPLQREGLFFALGKVQDETGDYEQAFSAFRSANELGQQRFPAYDPQQVENFMQRQEQLFTRDFIQTKSTGRPEQPLFICGMLRSGSTLVEQILARHSRIHNGGELDVLPWLVNHRLSPYPGKLQETGATGLDNLAGEYLALLRNVFPGAENVTDKRPDNFIFLGLIKILFPRARIIYTSRFPLDNCLSVYFQQLGGNLNYSTSLEHTGHYYRQHLRLMQHWFHCFSENIHTIDYDKLVESPEPVIRSMLEFLDMPWQESCMNFNETANEVKTASLWQIREPLHARSSGRWKNYSSHLDGLRKELEKQ